MSAKLRQPEKQNEMTATPLSENATIAVIGAGQAAAQAVQTLRKSGFTGRLCLIGDEVHAPYQRPPLSKKYLAGTLAAERLALLPDVFYTENNVECRFGMPVAKLDPSAGNLTMANGDVIRFDRALIATGSRSRALPMRGAELPGVYSLRSIADVDRLRPDVQIGQRVIIIGGGYIGLEVAAIVRGLGLEVTVVEAADRVMARTAPAVVSRYFEKLHAKHGVAFDLGSGVERIRQNASGKLEIVTGNGIHEADWVLVGIGAVPNVEIAERAGLTIENGIAVDNLCCTSAPNIFAAGDCTSFPSAHYGRRLRLESVQNAIEQGKAAALAMLGEAAAYDPVPWFWSDQYNTKFQIAGLSQFSDEHIVRGDPATGTFSVAHLRDGRLIALDAINQPRDYMHARRMVPHTTIDDGHTIADAAVPLNEAVVSRSP